MALTKFLVCTVDGVHPSMKQKRELVKFIQPSSDIDSVLECDDLTEMYASNFSRTNTSASSDQSAPFSEIKYKAHIHAEQGNFMEYVVERNDVQVTAHDCKLSIDHVKDQDYFLSIYATSGKLIHRDKIDD